MPAGDLDRAVDVPAFVERGADDAEVLVVEIARLDCDGARCRPEADDQVAPALRGELDALAERRYRARRLDHDLATAPASHLLHLGEPLLGRLDVAEVDRRGRAELL